MGISKEILDAAGQQFCADCCLPSMMEEKSRNRAIPSADSFAAAGKFLQAGKASQAGKLSQAGSFSAAGGNPDAVGGTVRIGKLPDLPEQGFMTDAAYAALLRERLEQETGRMPRIYEGMDPFFRAICGMGRVWMAADERIFDWCQREYMEKESSPEWFGCFSQMQRLNGLLHRYGRTIEDGRLNFLPAEKADMGPVENSFEIRWYEEAALWDIRDPWPFRHALCGTELMPCRLAVAAVWDGKILGMAGVAQDSPLLCQIGVDVGKECAGRGIGTTLVRLLKEEVLRRGKIPFYGTASSHIISIRTALSAGFLPAWTEIYVRKEKR